MLLASDQRRVRYVPLEVIDALERECKAAFGGLQPEIQGGLSFIYPGTKWCGPGRIPILNILYTIVVSVASIVSIVCIQTIRTFEFEWRKQVLANGS